MSTTNPFWLCGVSNSWQGKWCQGVHSKHYPFPHLICPPCDFSLANLGCAPFFTEISWFTADPPAQIPCVRQVTQIWRQKVKKKEKSLVKLSPSLFWCLITEKKTPNKQTKALFFLFLVWCKWCFCELRNFRAAENLSLAYWIEFFWLLISELLWLFAENFWRAGTGFDSICQQFLFNYRERGEGRSWEILGDTDSPKSAWQEKNKGKQDLVSLAWS